MNKHYFVKIEIQIGEFEKIVTHLVEAENSDAAIIQAISNESHDDSEYDEDWDCWVDGCGEFLYRPFDVKMVDWEDYEILKKYL
jgi:hypothetical protein